MPWSACFFDLEHGLQLSGEGTLAWCLLLGGCHLGSTCKHGLPPLSHHFRLSDYWLNSPWPKPLHIRRQQRLARSHSELNWGKDVTLQWLFPKRILLSFNYSHGDKSQGTYSGHLDLPNEVLSGGFCQRGRCRANK